ncbi:MAG: ATP-binding cassette domain-containing protein [Propionibacteriaceae bacterium]|nr:ATP-binding cassette domain-containing protein [Propionibacteriaceae bacterium]
MSVSASRVGFRYAAGEAAALADFDLTVEPGEFVVLSGPSGCGKTTATRLLNGLIPHFHDGELSGDVRVFGGEPARQRIWETATEVGSVFQNPRSQFFTTDPVSEIAFGCENLGLDAETTRARVEENLRRFGLHPLRERSIFALSGGEKQRLACASVAATEPRLYVLDEPSANLDASATARLRQAMAAWKAAGAAVVVAEHRLGYLRELVDRLILLDHGRIVGEYTGERFRAMDEAGLAALGLRRTRVPEPPMAAVGEDAAALEIVDLEYRHARRKVPGVPLRDPEPVLRLDRLAIPRGKVTALVGPNGAGKTTLVRWLAGLSPNQAGRLLDMGRRVGRRERRRRVFLVHQDVNHQLVTESVADEIALTLRLAGARGGVEAQTERALAGVDLQAQSDRHPMSLSAGQKQRLAIGTALASGRELVILDEPTSGLDLAHMRQVAGALRQLAAAGRTVLVATHDTELIAACADHLIGLDRGRLTR